jgi:MFS family permease
MGRLIPSTDERTHLGGFYLAALLVEATHLALPFQVLLIVRYVSPGGLEGASELGIIFGCEQLVSLVMEVPTGAWADRFGRKACVLLGYVFEACGWLACPLATLLDPGWRLAGMCGAFALRGAGVALISGAHEAWVVDNLKAHTRSDLILPFFGRERSLAAIGGIVADLIALVAVAWVDMRLFWVATGLGQLVTAALLARIAESPIRADHLPFEAGPIAPQVVHAPLERPDLAAIAAEDADHDDGEAEEQAEDEEFDEPRVSVRQALRDGLRAIVGRRPLLALTLLLVWMSATFGLASEAFQAALTDAGLQESGFAALELGVDGIGAVGPLLVLILVGRIGSRRLLALGVLLPALLALGAWRWPTAAVLCAAYLLVVSMIGMFQTVADEYQHQLLSSASRATASSAINLLVSLAGLISAGWLTILLARMPASSAVGIMGLCTLPAVLLLLKSNVTSRKVGVCDE